MLKRVSIQNFKSLKDVTLDLQKVNLLIGPNNSGKTNFLKALEYMVKDNNNQDEPDFERIAFRQDLNKIVSIRLIFEPKDVQFSIEQFNCIIRVNDLEKKHALIQKTKEKIPKGVAPIDLLDIPKKDFSSSALKEFTGPITIYKPDPNKFSQPGPVGIGEDTVNSNASNLVGFLDLMLGKYRKTVFNRTESDLHKCVPEFDEINLDDASATEDLKKQFGDKSFKRLGLTNNKQGVTYWADELSEGTLYFLALLCIINQPNPPKLLLLEEPEKGIHPRRLFEVMQFIFSLVEEKDVQVIMTTHSPIVVDMFKDMTESVFIFDKYDDGATHVKNLQRDIIEPETVRSKKLEIEPPHYTDSLGDAWTVGFLGGVPK